jgi:glyoxylase-like metal-dependent hydrolase (beta-lactamase superfamily II)
MAHGMPLAQPAEGVLRLGSSMVNWYLVADDDGVVLVDAGAPRHRPQLEEGLEQLGRSLDDVRAVILTHADADHRGFAEKLREERGVSVHLHSADERLATTGKKDTEAGVLPYLRHPAAWKMLGVLAAGGVPKKLSEVQTFEDGAVLDVPGKPRVIHAPGHTHGCVAFHFERHGALFVGDVLYGFGVLTGETGAQIGPRAFNASSEQALESLSKLEGVEADVMLFGHGEPWTQGVGAAVSAARARGAV